MTATARRPPPAARAAAWVPAVLLGCAPAGLSAASADLLYKLLDPAPLHEPFSVGVNAAGEGGDDAGGAARWVDGALSLPAFAAGRFDGLLSVDAQAIALDARPVGGDQRTRLRAGEATAVARVQPGAGWVLGGEWTERRSSDGSAPWRAGSDREVDAFARYDLGDRQALVAFATYDTQRRWLDATVIPGVGWLIAPDDQHWLLLGAPTAYGYWQPVPWWSIEGGVIQDPHAALTLYPSKPWSVALAYDWRTYAFRSLTGTTVLEEMRLTVGATWDPTAWCELSAFAGLAFDRSLEVGADRHGRDGDRRALPAGPVGGLGAIAGF